MTLHSRSLSSRPLWSDRRRRRARALIAAVTTTVVAVGLAQAPASAASTMPGYKPRKPAEVPAVAVRTVKPSAAPTAKLPSALDAPAPVWPAAATVEVSVPSSGSRLSTSAGPVRAGSMPVLVDNPGAGRPAPDRVKVQVFDRATTSRAKVEGLLLRVGRADGHNSAGEVAVNVDYHAFRTAYGASWASRLRLVRLPECALSTPDSPACAPVWVASSRNHAASEVVTATVPVPAASSGTLVALVAAASGPSGDYTATALKPSSTWSAGGNSGGFSWSYPMRVPPAPGGLAPTVSLDYSSQSVDGRHPAANNQPSWAGGGFEGTPGGYVERRYRPCADDMDPPANNTEKTGDECWATQNAVLNLNGASSELIFNASEGRWHLRNDDGSRVQRLLGATNGDGGVAGSLGDQGEYWIVTTTDGTQYWFGKHRLPGWASGNPVTNSTWTVPVYGNNPDEPCYNASSFASSSCVQAWRWNLDYVVDMHGNSMSYWYAAETNKYGRNNTPSDPATYTRGGYLDHISYGTRRDSDVDSSLAGTAPAKVVFATADRCLSGCSAHDGTHWPDVPWDQECAAVATSCDDTSPTFWTTRRLSTITTQIRNSAGGYDNVERWTLTHTFPDPGDTTQAGLWLDKLSHQGLVGTTTNLPDVTFTGLSKDNRVDGIDSIDAMAWLRLVRIDTETGGAISVTYSDRDCVAGGARPTISDNNRLCYPVKWVPQGDTSAKTDWFHKYVVTEVSETDMVAGGPQRLYHYTYLGDPAWHYNDDDGIIKPSYKTWSDWRGYGLVGVTVGDPDSGDQRTYAETRYFRGMNGDKQPSGTRSVTITDSKNGSWPDDDWLAGTAREQVTFNGPGGPVVSGAINDPWPSPATASRTVNNDTVTAHISAIATVKNRTVLDAGRPDRVTKTTTSFDAYGMPTQVDDLGLDGVSGDERCTKTTYEPRNTTDWIMTKAHRVQSFAVDCTAAGTPASLTNADVISDLKTTYDSGTYATAPATGDPTKVEEMSAWSATSPTYVITSQATYDTYGRVTQTKDANTYPTNTVYTQTNGLVSASTVTNALGHTVTTTVNPAWGLATTVVDANNKHTDMTYDGLGHLTAVWKPGRVKDVDTANLTFAYDLRKDRWSTVTAKALNPSGGYTTSHTLFDGLLRQVQTQTASPSQAGGRILTNTFYDSLGRAKETYGAYYNTTTLPTTTPDLAVPVEPRDIPTQNRTIFDGAGRAIADIFEPYNAERWRTSTYYAGDRTDVTPPEGGTATSTVADARGNTTQLWQHPRNTAWNSGQATTYTYNRKNQLAATSDAAGNIWTYIYDIRGRKITDSDPDRGTTTYTYDNGGRVSTTVDGRNLRLAYTYDTLNRRTGVYNSVPAGTPRASWQYDNVAKGQLTTSMRYFSGTQPIQTTVTEYGDDYQPKHMYVDVPSAETGLFGTYNYGYSYNPDGSLDAVSFSPSTTSPATDLPTETIRYGYNDLGQSITLKSTYGTDQLDYVNDTHYDALGQADHYKLCTDHCDTNGHSTLLDLTRELETGRPTHSVATRDTATPYNLADLNYSYDNAGNITKIQDIVDTDDTQCYTQDFLARLTDAWTPTSGDCTTTPTTAGLGGPAPYWLSWQYDTTGNRVQQVDHKTSGNVTTTSVYPAAGAAKPHAVTSTTSGGVTGSYTYDNAGDTLTRPGGGGTQTLTWDLEGKLATTSDPSGNTSYLYDADGDRLIRRDATGKTLYLPGQEIRYTTGTNTKTVTRYYTFNGMTVASRTATGLTWLLSDHQGTSAIAIDATSNAVTQRRQTPFATPRGTPTTWPNEKGFLGGSTDPTGLTHLGAREYDPTTGRFISVDPILDLADPQQWNGYAYANNSPISSSDPSGLKAACGPGFDIPCGSYDNHPKCTNCGAQTTPGGNTVDHVRVGGSDGKPRYAPTINSFVLPEAEGRPDEYQLAIAMDKYCAAQPGDRRCGKPDAQHTLSLLVGICMLPGDTLCEGTDFQAQLILRNNRLCIDSGACSPRFSKIFASVAEVASAMGPVVVGRDGRGSGGRRGSACSFTPDTPVAMADGTTQPIKDVQVGDKVAATDPATGKTRPEPVTALHVNQDTDLTDVWVTHVDPHNAPPGPYGQAAGLPSGWSGPPATYLLHTTGNHPFWNQTTNTWTDAAQLLTGDHLHTTNGNNAIVAATRSYTDSQAMHNLTVDQLHTYYVMAGTTPVLVHNTCWSTSTEKAADLAGKYKPGQSTRDPASQWYHEELSNEELLYGINNAAEGDGIVVSRNGTILGGHHRWDELQTRINDGRIDPNTEIHIQIYGGE